jgi:ribosomal protein L28
MRQCMLCLKGSIIRGKRRLLRGHYNPVSQARKYPNLQKTTFAGIKLTACTKCIRTIAKEGR